MSLKSIKSTNLCQNTDVKVIKMVLNVYSEIPLSKNIHHIATSQLIRTEIKLTRFYMIQGFTERYFRKETSKALVLRMCLNYNLKLVHVL